tara:strand:- start:134 stop:8512 length:8379 start_codon:yes stop_codon:yes gene_type:complete
MPQETNLNVAPYFDDYTPEDNYHKILFKPGHPVQARELTGIQSILQNQIEKFGSHIFKDGSSVTGGGLKFNNGYYTIKINKFNEGIDVRNYLTEIGGKIIIGAESGVKAQIKGHLSPVMYEQFYVLIVNYLNTGGDNNRKFISNESILLDESVLSTPSGIVIQPGESIAQTVNGSTSFVGAAAVLSSGIYYARGYFIQVPQQTIILDPFTTDVSAQIGLVVQEEILNSDYDRDLYDNAAGYNNYTAPGADRLNIRLKLGYRSINADSDINFIKLMEVRQGRITSNQRNTEYDEISKEFARRTNDESGDYYVKPFSITPRNTLNNYEGNNGLFNTSDTTYNNNRPAESLGTYKISPGKAYVKGYEVESNAPKFLDFQKPRSTKTLENQKLNYFTGPTYKLNRVSGVPNIGIGTDYTVSLRDTRIGSASTTAAGKEIGVARVFDFAFESGAYNAANLDLNEWDISLYDIQTYTNIALNTPTTLSVPTHVKGKSSGATGYLKSAVSDSTDVTLYNTKGNFITGEQFIFNGIESGNISAGSTSYNTKDVKSIHGTVSTASTFNGDVVQSVFSNIGEVRISAATTDGAYLGISTVTSTDPNKFFIGIATVGNLVEYSNTNAGFNTVSYAKIESISQRSLTISGITTVSGVCEGGLPTVDINPSSLRIITSEFLQSSDESLYTPLPKTSISNVDLTNASITIRKQYDVTITDGSTGAVSSGSNEETFLPFDEERYLLIRTDGTIETLTQDKFSFNGGSTEVTIIGLGSNSDAKLIATLTKTNVKSKIKERKKINILTIVNSKFSQSGTGSTTLNDGLTYSTVYGTRVQDEEISLNTPDVTRVYGIFESKNTSAPLFPRLSLTNINSPNAKTGDLLIGESFRGKDSNAKGIYVSKHNDTTINYISLNENTFQDNEELVFEESLITSKLSSKTLGSTNISNEFTYNNGQRSTIYDYSRIKRKSNFKEPSKQLTVVFESAYFTASDTGDFTTRNSYVNFNYGRLPSIGGNRVTDIIDIRPRVSDFSGTTYSPFEFLGRSFDASGNSAKNILASDENLTLDYSFYLPRLDKIYLSKDGSFQLVKGTPAETPEFPNRVDGDLEIASISLPPYLYDIDDVNITITNYKRYQMSDISRLERRIENLEFYTSLSLLEIDTMNMEISDVDGLNRFKSGFIVDDFSDTGKQLKRTIVKNSIDYKNGELRPSHYTTELDLLLDLGSSNGIRKTGRVLSLDYEDIIELNQPYATRVENVTPYLVNYYGGTCELTPSSDIWVDQVHQGTKHSDLTTYTQTSEQVNAGGFDSNSGYGPVTWGSWNNNWTGGGGSSSHVEERYGSWEHVRTERIAHNTHGAWIDRIYEERDVHNVTVTTDHARTGTATRTGTRSLQKETFSTRNDGDVVVNTDIVSYMRSRNLQFKANRLRPQTSVYAFFDGENVDKYIVPKLLEISMTTGTFSVGETVIGTTPDGKELIRFKVAQSNHRSGDIDNPSSVYKHNPYYAFTPLYKRTILVDSVVPVTTNQSTTSSLSSSLIPTIPEEYSSTSTILNIDTLSLAEKSDNTFHGYVEKNLRLVGQTSSAQATVSEVRLRSDSSGTCIGCFFIPNPNDLNAPKFDTGTKVFRLSSSSTNSQVAGNVITDATEEFESTGTLQTLQESIVTIRNIRTHTQTQTQTKSISQAGYSVDSHVDHNVRREIRTRDETGWTEYRGCTDPEAKNYTPGANTDDGSCKYDIPELCPVGYYWSDFAQRCIKKPINIKVGCMDPKASNYCKDCNVEGVCEYPDKEIVGCMEEGAKNFNELANKPGPCNWPQDHGMITDTVSSTTKAAIAIHEERMGTGYYGQGDISTGQPLAEDVISWHPSTEKVGLHTPFQILDSIVEDGYNNVLGRDSDPSGHKYWVDELKETDEFVEFTKSLSSGDDKKHFTQTSDYQTAYSKLQTIMNNHLGYSPENTAQNTVGEENFDAQQFHEDTDWAHSGGKPVDLDDCLDDPLAQSFFVENTKGIFITKVDLYLGNKDNVLPLVVQIRPMKLGLPTTDLLPFSEVVIDPSDIKISNDATVATTVTFPSPVYLPGEDYYALVLLSASSNYTAWISRMGEVDVSTTDLPEADQIVVSTQPTLGSLFKSQNGATWNASQYEDLKFVLYRAQFNQDVGNINFVNPPLLTTSDDISPLVKDSLELSSNKIRVGLGTTVVDSGLTLGNTVQQMTNNATGNYVGSAGTATGNLTITNAGAGYTPSSGAWTYQDVSLITVSGHGIDATANLTISNGVASAATIASGGTGYSVGDVVGVSSVGINSLGRGIRFSITDITGVNQLILDNVQGEFETGVGKTVQYIRNDGVTVGLNSGVGGNVTLSAAPVTVTDGLHIKVYQKNHGMHSSQNTVTLTDIESDILPTTLSADYDNTSTGSLNLTDASEFSTFENVGVGTTNLGYAKVGSEIVSYTGVNNNTLTGVTRGVDSTQTLSHSSGDFAYKYELDTVSLRRINTNHNLADSTVVDPIGLDYYTIKVDMSTNGVDRSVGTSFPQLHFDTSKSAGGINILSSENIPFEIVTPMIQNITPSSTNLTAQLRTVTGGSIDGTETPYKDMGFSNISLISDNYMSSPRMIASRINETTSLTTLPDNRSLTLNLAFSSSDPSISPIVDLDRCGLIFTSNRLNNPIDDWINDNRVKTIENDPNAFVYALNPVTLETGATSIKISLAAHINVTSDIRAFYAVAEDPNDELIYSPFPGHSNLLSTGQVIDPSKNNGLPDKLLPKTDVIAYLPSQVIWNDYSFTIDNLPTFRYFSIKLVGTGTNQAQPPRIKDLRVIALA